MSQCCALNLLFLAGVAEPDGLHPLCRRPAGTSDAAELYAYLRLAVCIRVSIYSSCMQTYACMGMRQDASIQNASCPLGLNAAQPDLGEVRGASQARA